MSMLPCDEAMGLCSVVDYCQVAPQLHGAFLRSSIYRKRTVAMIPLRRISHLSFIGEIFHLWISPPGAESQKSVSQWVQ